VGLPKAGLHKVTTLSRLIEWYVPMNTEISKKQHQKAPVNNTVRFFGFQRSQTIHCGVRRRKMSQLPRSTTEASGRTLALSKKFGNPGSAMRGVHWSIVHIANVKTQQLHAFF